MAKKFFGASLKTTTQYFFDRENVILAMDKKTNAAFNYIGGTLRKTAVNSVKRSNSQTLHSPPGKPVRTQTDVYKKSILYEYEPRRKGFICGPKRLPIQTKVNPGNRRSIPELLEKGGIGRSLVDTYKRIKRKNKQRRKKTDKRFVWVKIPAGPRRYEPRPTMRLAYQKTVNRKNLNKAFATIGFRK